ncbi:MAG: glycerophosphodiester phosphodiesterase family protein [Eubacteriales bacterium]|nr:glycerophosphodiester phosphodiesterase family protein [Eubacteriales bacterium]
MRDLTLYDNRITNIEYSRLPGRNPNSMPHFLKSCEDGFDGLKADMRLTKDGEIILCHDEGYMLNAEGRITLFDEDHPEKAMKIRDLTLKEIMELRFEDKDNGEDVRPCTLDEMLGLCEKKGMIPYLTSRHETWREETSHRMGELLKKHGLTDIAIMNLYPGNKDTLAAINKYCGEMIACDTRREEHMFSKEMIDESADAGYKIICLCHFSEAPVTKELVDYARSRGVNIWEWGMTTREDVKHYLELGVNGFQMYTREVTNGVIREMGF